MLSARELARRALRQIRADDEFASRALAKLFAKHELDKRDRALATELTYGVLRQRTRLDFALSAHASRGLSRVSTRMRDVLRVGAYQLLFLSRVPGHAAVNEAVSAAKAIGGKRESGFVNGLLRALEREGEPALPERESDPEEYARVVLSLPAPFIAALREVRPGDWLTAAEGFAQKPALWARTNTTKLTPDELVARLREEGATISAERGEAIEIEAGIGDPSFSSSYREGAWTVQDFAAQLVVDLCPVSEARSVLDACAGVGGKTSHLAQRLPPGCRLDAADQSEERLEMMREHIERLGLPSPRSIALDLRGEGGELADDYDCVLLDAPCTGLGVIRRHPERKWRSEAKNETQAAALQSQLLDALAKRVRPGGALVYAVCSFTHAEGSAVVSEFLSRHPDYSLRRPPLDEQFLDGDFVRTWPDKHQSDAFFAALLIRAT